MIYQWICDVAILFCYLGVFELREETILPREKALHNSLALLLGPL